MVPILLGLEQLPAGLSPESGATIDSYRDQYLLSMPELGMRMLIDPETFRPSRVDLTNPKGFSMLTAKLTGQVPVEGRLVFLDSAEFTKGVPQYVSNLDQLHADFGEPDKAAGKFKIEAFKPHWDLIRKAALGSQVGAMYGQQDG